MTDTPMTKPCTCSRSSEPSSRQTSRGVAPAPRGAVLERSEDMLAEARGSLT